MHRRLVSFSIAAAVLAGCSDNEPGSTPSPQQGVTTSLGSPSETTTTTAVAPVPETTTTTAASAVMANPEDPILCDRYRHPLHHLTCEEADAKSAARQVPSTRAATPRTTQPSRRTEDAAPAQQPVSAQLASIRACESGGDYQAVSPSGKYHGAYQFDLATWAAAGGSGNPANASPAEQDARAQAWIDAGHRGAWPNC